MSNIPEKPENQPRWLTEHYEGMEQDIMDWYYAFYFNEGLRLNPSINIRNARVFAETVATARLRALIQTGALKARTGKSIVLQMYEAQKSGWWKDLGEVRSIGELIELALMDAIENEPRGGNRYELEKLLKIIFACEQMGVDKSLIVSIPQNMSKARESTRVIDHIMQSPAEDETKREQIEGILKEVADKEITFETFRKNSHARMGKVGKTVMPPVPASLYLLPGGKELVVIETATQAETRTIESALKGLIADLYPRDITSLIKMISDKAMTKGKQHFYVCKDDGDGRGPMLVRANDGVMLPTHEEFQSLALQEVSHTRLYLHDLLKIYHCIDVPVFEAARVSANKEPDSMAAMVFHFNGEVKGALEKINSAIRTFYTPIHFDIISLINGLAAYPVLRINEEGSALTVWLRILDPGEASA